MLENEGHATGFRDGGEARGLGVDWGKRPKVKGPKVKGRGRISSGAMDRQRLWMTLWRTLWVTCGHNI